MSAFLCPVIRLLNQGLPRATRLGFRVNFENAHHCFGIYCSDLRGSCRNSAVIEFGRLL